MPAFTSQITTDVYLQVAFLIARAFVFEHLTRGKRDTGPNLRG